MKKKGFTLIEIIISIGVLAILGVASFVGIRLVTNNIRINKLSQITNKALEAAQIYIETNNEAYNQLYEKENGVVLPLNVLVNEGLLSLENTDLTKDDIEDEYVMTALSTSSSGEDCTDINSVTSWDSSAPIYLCINQSTGSTNISIINPDEIGNLNTVNREVYYFKGYDVNNYAKFKKSSTSYLNLRIFSVDTDDSLTVVNNSSTSECSNKWDNYFEQNMSFTKLGGSKSKMYITLRNSFWTSSRTSSFSSKGYNSSDNPKCGGNYLTLDMIIKTFDSNSLEGFFDPLSAAYQYPVDSWLFTFGSVRPNWYSGRENFLKEKIILDEYLHLKPCIKITSGTGASDNPYILEKKGTC